MSCVCVYNIAVGLVIFQFYKIPNILGFSCKKIKKDEICPSSRTHVTCHDYDLWGGIGWVFLSYHSNFIFTYLNFKINKHKLTSWKV